MSGFIQKAEVIQCRKHIVATWGEDFYNACLEAEGTSFLSMLVKHGKI